MQKIPDIASFDVKFSPKQLDQYVRRSTHIVPRTRRALADYHLAAQVRHHVAQQVDALQRLADCATEYCIAKNVTLPSNRPKHIYMHDLKESANTLINEIGEHAQRAHDKFQQAHHSPQLPGNVAHANQRISTGVNLSPEYRLEHFVAKHGPNRRMHGGDFLDQQQIGHDALPQMTPLQIYELVKKFKHIDHRSKHLEYFDNTQRTGKLLTKGNDGTVLMAGQLLDTTGNIEKKRFNTDGTFQSMSGRSYMQNSGGNDGFAVYACSISGDFYVHLDLADHAGTYQHSTIMAGSEVTCAGTIYAEKGHVKILTNNSGHYRPSAADLRDAMVEMYLELKVKPETVLILAKDARGKYWMCTGETLLKMQAGQTLESLPSNECFPWEGNSSEAIRNMTPDELLAMVLSAKGNQNTTIATVRGKTHPWKGLTKPK